MKSNCITEISVYPKRDITEQKPPILKSPGKMKKCTCMLLDALFKVL